MHKTFLLLLALIVLPGCSFAYQPQTSEPLPTSDTWMVKSCFFDTKELTCTQEDFVCAEVVRPSQLCKKFVSCTDTGNIVKDKKYDLCVDCFAMDSPSQECLNTFEKAWFLQ